MTHKQCDALIFEGWAICLKLRWYARQMDVVSCFNSEAILEGLEANMGVCILVETIIE